MAIVRGVLEINVRQLPEVVAKIRREMSGMLREAAQDENAHTAQRLREIAATFETGAQEGDADGDG